MSGTSVLLIVGKEPTSCTSVIENAITETGRSIQVATKDTSTITSIPNYVIIDATMMTLGMTLDMVAWLRNLVPGIRPIVVSNDTNLARCGPSFGFATIDEPNDKKWFEFFKQMLR